MYDIFTIMYKMYVIFIIMYKNRRKLIYKILYFSMCGYVYFHSLYKTSP